MNLTSLISGLVFIVLGALFLLDRLAILDVSAGLVLPIMLVGVGAGVLLGSMRRDRQPPAEPSPDAD